MRKETIFAVTACITGVIAGYFIGKKCTERKIEKDSEKHVPFNLYPEDDSDEENLDEFDPEDSEDDIATANGIAEQNNYIPVEDNLDDEDVEAMEAAKEYQQYIERHTGEIMVVSPNYEKRSDTVNNVIELMESEMLLYFPDEDDLRTEAGDRCDIEEFVGNCLYKYGFTTDPKQKELYVMNIPHEMYYIVRKETEDSAEDLFPDK